MISKAIIAMVVIFILSTWIYATGNLPGTLFAGDGLSKQLNTKNPILTHITSQLCGYTWTGLRKIGLQIPLSHQERCQIIELIEKIKRNIELFDRRKKSNAFQNYV